MSSGRLRSALSLHAQRAQGVRTSGARYGFVTDWDPASHSVKVRVQPEDYETGWFQWLPVWAGAGWGLYLAPAVGTQVEIHFQEGDPQYPMGGFAVPNDDAPPCPVPSGEAWWVHKSGSFLKFTNDPAVLVHSAGVLTMTTAGDLSITSQGAVSVVASGNATLQANAVTITSSDVELGGTGGKKVVLDGDPVSGGVVHASSTKVKAL